MSKQVISINVEDDLKSAVEIVKKHKIRHLPVIKGKKVVGIISSTDLNRLTFGNLFENQEGADEAVLEMLSIGQVMSDSPHVVSSDALIKEVAEIFAKEPFHALPVVDGVELQGIVTTTDVIEYLLQQY